MSELFAVLLSWAVTLSGYPMPEHPPEVVAVPHSFFVERACGGRECAVFGWYAGGDKLYIDERMNARTDLLSSSVVVHEMVHYLQNVRRGGGKYSCREYVAMEREAYGVQREYLLRYGSIQPVGVSMAHASCEAEA